MDETNIDSTLTARYRALEVLVGSKYSKSLPKIAEGGRIILFQDDVSSAGLSDAQLLVMGALVRLVTYYGNTIVIGRFKGVTLAGYDMSDDE